MSIIGELIYKYLDSSYTVCVYNSKSNFPPKKGCLLFSKLVNEEVSWGNFNRNLAEIFSIHISDAKYYSSGWYENKAKIATENYKKIQNA